MRDRGSPFRRVLCRLDGAHPRPGARKGQGGDGEGEGNLAEIRKSGSPTRKTTNRRGELAKFAESLQHERDFLRKEAGTVLFQWYAGYVFDLPWHPCNCKLALPECDCPSRDRPPPGAPKPAAWPRGERPLVKQSLYSGKKPRWWSDARYSGSKSKDDPIIRSHDKSASVGMKGFNAGTKGVWKNDNAEYYPEQDDRASTRDWNKTARDGEKALQKPYDSPEGTPKSWSNPSDVEPDNEEVTRIGKRVIEEGEIEPYKRKKGYSEDDE